MARRLTFYLVIAASLCFAMAFYLFKQFGGENQIVLDYLHSTAKLLNQLTQVQIDYSLTVQNPIQNIEIAGIAEKTGRILLYDQTLKKTVAATRLSNGSIKIVTLDISSPRVDALVFISDSAGALIFTNEPILLGSKLSTVMNIELDAFEATAMYKGKKFKVVQMTNERYGYKVTVAYPLANPFFNMIMLFVVLLSSGFVVLLVFLLERREKVFKNVVESLREILSEKFQIQSPSKNLPQLLKELDEQIENREQLLKRTVEEIKKIKENLQKFKRS